MYSNRIKTAYISEITYMEQNEFCVCPRILICMCNTQQEFQNNVIFFRKNYFDAHVG